MPWDVADRWRVEWLPMSAIQSMRGCFLVRAVEPRRRRGYPSCAGGGVKLAGGEMTRERTSSANCSNAIASDVVQPD